MMPTDLECSQRELNSLMKWLLFELAPNASSVELLQGFADRLCGLGVDLRRGSRACAAGSPSA